MELENVDITKPISFHVKDDFHFKIGEDEKPITVKRLKFRDAENILNLIKDVICKDTEATFKVLAEAKRTDITLEAKSFESYSKTVNIVLGILIRDKNYKVIVGILVALSGGIFTEEIIEELQYNEVCDILSFLLNNNFASLKNLSASLQVISMSTNREKI